MYECPVCNRRFPLTYEVKNIASKKECGTKQLMRLHAQNNFRKHVRACAAKKCCLCDTGDQPVRHHDGMMYHGKARCKAYRYDRSEL